MQNGNVGHSIAALALVVFAAIGIFGIIKFDQFLKIKALDDCAKASVYTFETRKGIGSGEETVARSQESVKDSYKTCVTEKGYESALVTK